MTVWTFVRGKVKLSLPDGTHSPKLNSPAAANRWLKKRKEREKKNA